MAVTPPTGPPGDGWPTVARAARSLPGTPVRMLCTDTAAGDQRGLVREPGSPARLPGMPPVPLYGARQVHGARVLVVTGAFEAGAEVEAVARAGMPSAGGACDVEDVASVTGIGLNAGGLEHRLGKVLGVPGLDVAPWRWLDGSAPEGDAVVARGTGRAAVVLTADCVPLVVGSADGIFAAVHVGWRGLVAGVVEAVAETFARLGARDPVAALGPSIGPCCYGFSPEDLAVVARRTAGSGLSTTRSGAPALDLPAAVRSVAQASGLAVTASREPCTACSGMYFSHRARRDEARQATVVWCETPHGRDQAVRCP